MAADAGRGGSSYFAAATDHVQAAGQILRWQAGLGARITP